MNNREKIISAIEKAKKDSKEYAQDAILVPFKEADIIIALLKEQEPVKPIRLENWWKCPSCSGNIVANMHYCPRCGRSVKWDD